MEVSDIIESVDILDYISQFCEFEEKGGEYWALSPLKEENTPSFSVNKTKQLFYDFSSGRGGNVLSFIELYNNCDFFDALKILKEYAHISDADINITQRLQSTKVARLYRNKAKELISPKHPILRPDYMNRYEFNQDKMRSWFEEGISWDVLHKYDVRYDPFSDRVVYPVKDYDGNIISVCGRTLDPNYKANKVRKYTYFQKIDTLNTLYGYSDHADYIAESKEVVIFEGAKSVMIADGWGFQNTVAILTSHLNDYQLLFLIKLGVRAVFALDEDIDIYADENIMRLARYVRVDYVVNRGNRLGEKMAPVDAGIDTWKDLYEKRKRMN